MNILKRLKFVGAFFAGMIVLCSMGAVFDPQGREMINISGSTNILVAVTNSITSSVGNTVALPVTNATANVFTVQPGNTPNTVGWLVNVTNAITSSVGNTVALPVTNATANPFIVSATNSLTVGTMPVVAVTQSGTWDEVGINDSGNSITVDGTVSLPNTTTVSATNQLTLVNTTTVSATNTLTVGTMPVVAVSQSGTWDEVGINDSGNSITVDGTVTVTDGSGALNVIVDSITAGNNNIGDVDVASIAAGDNNIGNVDIVTMPTVTVTDGSGALNVIIDSSATIPVGQHLIGSTATNVGGYTPFMQVSAATVNTNTWSATPCTLGYITAFNSNMMARYLCIIDSTTNRSPAEGSTSVLVAKFMIPGATNGSGFVVPIPYGGMKLNNGLCTATVTGMATNDATAVGANEILISGGYKN